ncbi:Mitochondrial intermembrane space import and assembly protein 40 [Spathaspora sp. JA1]|nr:Mitochondrial intermembrane space import and assembly protein 40 [Spathaspora sp. JA1]
MYRYIAKSSPAIIRQSSKRVARSSIRKYSTPKPNTNSSGISAELTFGGIAIVAGLGYAWWSSTNGSKTESTFSKIKTTFQPEKFESKLSVHRKQNDENKQEAKEEVKEEVEEAQQESAVSAEIESVEAEIETPETTPEAVPGAAESVESEIETPETTPEVTPEVTPEATPEATPEPVEAAVETPETPASPEVDESPAETSVPENTPEVVAETPVEASETSDQEEQPEHQEGEAAYNPETGEINWDCPCLGGMAHGPCGEEFKDAFSCFVFSETEPKGIDCIKKFENMRSCFKRFPEHYKDELYEEDSQERNVEAVENNVLETVEPAVEEITAATQASK